MSGAQAPVLSTRALNRATLARQFLLERTRMPVADVVEHLVGLQAQTPHTAYVGLWSRIAGFRPDDVSALMISHELVRIALMRSTLFLVTARDARTIRPLIQVVHERMLQGQFGRRLEGLDRDAVLAAGRAYVEAEPRTFKALGGHLAGRWPDRDRFALEILIRTGVPLIQVPPRGLWGRSGAARHTSIEAWLGADPGGPPQRRRSRPALPGRLRTGECHGYPDVVRAHEAPRGVRAPAAGPRRLP